MNDFFVLQLIIDMCLCYGLVLIEEVQLLKGFGVGNNLNGIYIQVSQYVVFIVINNFMCIDVLCLVLLQVELVEYLFIGIVLNLVDWIVIELQKDFMGVYIFVNLQFMVQFGLWGCLVVMIKFMIVDEFLVGVFKMGVQIFDCEQVSVIIVMQNEDDFVKNLVMILVEECLVLVDYCLEVFVKGDLMLVV